MCIFSIFRCNCVFAFLLLAYYLFQLYFSFLLTYYIVPILRLATSTYNSLFLNIS